MSYIILLVFAVIYIGPLLMLINTSFKLVPFMRDATALATSINVKNFIDAWNKASFPKYLTNSVIYTVAATTIYIVMAVFVAFPISRKYIKGAKYFFTLFLDRLIFTTCTHPTISIDAAAGVIQ